MPRLMSVAFTEDAVVARTKTVTRRKGWAWLTPGTRLTLVEKAMGLKKGETVVRLAEVEVYDVRREPIDDLWTGNTDYGAREMAAEGFPGMDPRVFWSRYFWEAQGIPETAEVTRIEWRYLDDGAVDQ